MNAKRGQEKDSRQLPAGYYPLITGNGWEPMITRDGTLYASEEELAVACRNHRAAIVADARRNAGAYLRRVAFEVLDSEVADSLLSCAVVLETTGGPEPKGCEHDWIDVRNEVVKSGEMCRKCHAIRGEGFAEPSLTDIPEPEHEVAP